MSASCCVSCSWREEARRLFDRHRRDLADVFAADPYLPRFASQAQAAAVGAHGIAAIAAEKDAHVELVLLALQVLEEAAHAPEVAVAADDEVLLLGGEVVPGNIERNARSARVAAHLRGQRPVLRLGPGLDGAFGQRQRLVRNDQVQVEINGVAEALAARTRAVGIVEREQPRLRFFVLDVAVLAFKALREAQALRCSPSRGAVSKITSPASR